MAEKCLPHEWSTTKFTIFRRSLMYEESFLMLNDQPPCQHLSLIRVMNLVCCCVRTKEKKKQIEYSRMAFAVVNTGLPLRTRTRTAVDISTIWYALRELFDRPFEHCSTNVLSRTQLIPLGQKV